MDLTTKTIIGLEGLISPEIFLVICFTVLGAMVTLISISSSLTKEVRQSLFFNYYIKSNFSIIFLTAFIVLFLSGIIAAAIRFQGSGILLSVFVVLLFYSSVSVVLVFVYALNRRWLYRELFKQFKKIIQRKKKARTKAQLKPLDDFVKNLTYIETRSCDFIEEIDFIKNVSRVALKTNNGDILDQFFEQLKNIEDPRFFGKLRNSLRYLIQEYFNDLRIVTNLQKIYTGLLIHSFWKTKEFDENLNTDRFTIRYSFDVQYVHTYKKTNDKEWIKDYEGLAVNTINRMFNLCWQIIYLDIRPKYKKRYLTEQIGSMVKILEYYNPIHEEDFLENYNHLKYKEKLSKNEKNSLELVDEKVKIIKDLKEVLWDRVSELFYLILYEIDLGTLQKDFFETIREIFRIDEFKKQYYSDRVSRDLKFLNYNRFQGGAQSIAPFNFTKYKLLLSLYQYVQTGYLDVAQYSDEHFSQHKVSDFRNQVNGLHPDFVGKCFDIEMEKLTEFKKKVEKEAGNKVKTLEKNKREYIANTDLKEEFVKEFKSDCKEYWNKNQKFLKRFLKYTEKEGGNKIKNFFRQYTLYDKEWFLDSFDKTISLYRSHGKDFGKIQVESKRKAILSKIDKMLNEESYNDDKIIIKDLYADLKKLIVKNKEYFLFYNWDLGKKIIEIPDIKGERDEGIAYSLEINNSKVHLCLEKIENSLLFVKDSFILEQFKEGYEDMKETLVVKIEEIKDKKEIEIIKKNSKGKYKTDEDVKQKVKLKIAEKFNIKRSKGASFVRLKV